MNRKANVHPGKVDTIEFTSTLEPRVIPNVIEIGIGCAMTLAQVKGKVKEYYLREGQKT